MSEHSLNIPACFVCGDDRGMVICCSADVREHSPANPERSKVGFGVPNPINEQTYQSAKPISFNLYRSNWSSGGAKRPEDLQDVHGHMEPPIVVCSFGVGRWRVRSITKQVGTPEESECRAAVRDV